MRRTRSQALVGMAVSLAVLSGPTEAEVLIDPTAPCQQVLARTHEDFRIAQVAWSAGFLAAESGTAAAIDGAGFDALLQTLRASCAADPTQSFRSVVAAEALRARAAAVIAGVKGGEGADTADQAGDGAAFGPTEAGAEALLRRFLAPNADHAALTRDLAPTPADYRAVYREPLATALEQQYAPLWRNPPPIRPKPGQTALLLTIATTEALMAHEPVLAEFPGGYRRILDRMNPGVPIVRFKFVRPGETLGLAFDGLVHVNGRWVLIPKPWRAADR